LNAPWINNDFIAARTKLRNLYSQSTIQEHRDKYKPYKKECNVVIITANQTAFSTLTLVIIIIIIIIIKYRKKFPE
jgi:hypothetical protein